jgi:hypothetical protein
MTILPPSEISGFLRRVLTVPPVIPVLVARGKCASKLISSGEDNGRKVVVDKDNDPFGKW